MEDDGRSLVVLGCVTETCKRSTRVSPKSIFSFCFFCKTTFKNCLTVLLLSTGMYHPPVLFWFWTLESTLLSVPEKVKTSIIRLREKKAIIASGSTFEKSLKTREIEKVAVFFFKNNVGLANFYYRPKSSWNRQKKLESRKLSYKVLGFYALSKKWICIILCRWGNDAAL